VAESGAESEQARVNEVAGELAPGATALASRYFLAAVVLTAAYVAVVAWIAGRTGLFYIMFPELGALAYDVFERPNGGWSRSPLHLATTPLITAGIGTLITRSLAYGPLSITLDVGAALAVIMALGSPISPAISAGLLPLVLGVRSRLYPPAILFGTALLAALTLPWRRLVSGVAEAALYGAEPEVHPTVEPRPWGWAWMGALIAFVAVAAVAASLTGLRMVLFPPLAVIAFETFYTREADPWGGRVKWIPLACFATAGAGLLFVRHFGASPEAAALSVLWSVAVLRVLKLHLPPALAVGLLPMVMKAPDLFYPIAVGAGTLLLVGWFFLYRRLMLALALSA
jgi:hypothetical protein